MLFIPFYPLVATIPYPWLEIAILLAIATIAAAILIVLIKWVQRQRYLRRALPWFVRSLVAVSVISLAFQSEFDATSNTLVIDEITYLIFIVLPFSGLIGLFLGLSTAPIVSLARRSFWAGGRIGFRMVKGSTLAAVLVYTICCHQISDFPNLSDERAGDHFMSVTTDALVLWLAILPASFMGSIIGGIVNGPVAHKGMSSQ